MKRNHTRTARSSALGFIMPDSSPAPPARRSQHTTGARAREQFWAAHELPIGAVCAILKRWQAWESRRSACAPPTIGGNRMLGLMQDWPLTIHKIIDFAAIQHPNREVVSRLVEGPIHRTNYREVRD